MVTCRCSGGDGEMEDESRLSLMRKLEAALVEGTVRAGVRLPQRLGFNQI